jgi:hypothetical protein
VTKPSSRALKLSRATLIQITGPGFTAHLLIYRGEVLECAPILQKWVYSKQGAADVLDSLRKRGFGVKAVDREAPDAPDA